MDKLIIASVKNETEALMHNKAYYPSVVSASIMSTGLWFNDHTFVILTWYTGVSHTPAAFLLMTILWVGGYCGDGVGGRPGLGRYHTKYDKAILTFIMVQSTTVCYTSSSTFIQELPCQTYIFFSHKERC